MFICYSTPNYQPLTNVCLRTLRECGGKHIEHLLDTPSDELLAATGFQSPMWYYATKQKIVHLINTLKKFKGSSDYKYFVFTDCDIVFIRKNASVWESLEDHIISLEDKDIIFMNEGTSSTDVNSGFFIIKNNERIDQIIAFFEEVVDIFTNSNIADVPLGDQTIINGIKGKLQYGTIPNEYVVCGHIIFKDTHSLIQHAVGSYSVEEKFQRIMSTQTWFR